MYSGIGGMGFLLVEVVADVCVEWMFYEFVEEDGEEVKDDEH